MYGIDVDSVKESPQVMEIRIFYSAVLRGIGYIFDWKYVYVTFLRYTTQVV